MSLFLANAWGFIWEHKRAVLIALGVCVVLIIILIAVKCGRKPASINQESIEKINKANEVERKAELHKTISENADVVVTVDQRTTIAEVSEAEKQAQIWAKIQEADRKIQEAKASTGRDVTAAELECLLTGVCQ